MLSKSKIKLITSLSQKKFRDEAGLFVAEGTKLVMDLAPDFRCRMLVATPQWLGEHGMVPCEDLEETSEADIRRVSNQKTPQGVLALFQKPDYSWDADVLENKLSLALDGVQDPGNLGTVIRVADWFGIGDIFCSGNSADAFGPKTVQATMGALARVRVHTVDLAGFLGGCKDRTPVYGTFMDGESIYSKKLSASGIIVMGNEGNGISPGIEKLVGHRVLVPNFPQGQPTSESLNVGVATALVCAEFRRREIIG
ncbi:MAG TPA: RNA methyltransferase [Paludibacter sp.]|nr:RNA methyltransferase [Paludibacter sp.]